MNLSSPAQVAELLRKHNLQPRKRFGQNFLIDFNTLQKIIRSASVELGDGVCEIGSGLGVLTIALSEAVGPEGRVVTIEVDDHILPALMESIAGRENVVSVQADALEIEWPMLIASNFGVDRKIKLVANIPYNITTPILSKLLENKTSLSCIVLLVQKEVADRLVAKPDTANYGSLSVFAQYHARVESVGVVSRKVFYPAPDVDSAIVRLTPYIRPVDVPHDEQLFFRVVRAAFGQRRKALPNALSGDPALDWSRERATYALQCSNIDPRRRGETLTISEFILISNAGEVFE